MAPSNSNNDNTPSYEEARKQRLEENKRRLEELGILKLSKSLSEATTPAKKLKPKLKISNTSLDMAEVRRSSRERSSIVSYSEEFKTELPQGRKKSKPSTRASYLGRQVEEVRYSSNKERVHAMKCAKKFQNDSQSEHPSFSKSMLHSHVYRGFWLGLPAEFCQQHLPSDDVTMVLVDKDGSECDSTYKGEKRGLSAGWRGFALDHKLEDGDALVFELIEPKKFKVYVFKASELPTKKAAMNSNKKGSKKSVKQ